MRRVLRRSPFACVAATWTTATLIGCGAAPSGSPQVGAEVRSTDAANVARSATEPRGGDPTAAAGPTTLEPAVGRRPLAATRQPAAVPAGSSDPSASTPNLIPAAADPARIGARHVLIQYMGSERAASSVVRSREQALAVAKEVLKHARQNEDFARLAIEFSDEPGAGSRGGSLGRFGHGQMVPAFEAAAFKLEVGQISGIVETPFGFHIIQRTE